ncbi:MAG: hypothetical protein IBX57_00345 [Gammaproteobacteria bacterium]|nr:hypothetical protein [Gammaproteobacteria bacterium]
MSNELERLKNKQRSSLPSARKKDVDFASKLNGVGSLSSAQSDNLRGINLNLSGTPAPKNQDSYGYTFFTRPDLNMSYDNLAMNRMLTPLLTDDTKSMARALRCMLDPRGERQGQQSIKSEIFNYRQAFLPVLTNNLINISGWPDIVADTYTSKEGVYKESYSMVDGTTHIFNTFDITANFRNIQGDPITLLFAVWVTYQSMVYDGTMVPYPDLILENEIDYNTRIYRLVMDETYKYVQKIAACGAAFPLAAPLGASFNYSNETNYNQDNDQISIPFRCMGVNYLDPILVKEFNQTVVNKFPSMSDKSNNRNHLMVQISDTESYGDDGNFSVNPKYGAIGRTLMNLLNYSLYPRINPDTMELEWWTTKSEYTMAINELKQKGII